MENDNSSSTSVKDTANGTAAAQYVGNKHSKLPIRNRTTSTGTIPTLNFSSQVSSFPLRRALGTHTRTPSTSHHPYFAYPKSDRARKAFLLKRHHWKISRQRSFYKMEFIEKIREMQANESSSSDDDDLTFISTSSSSVFSSGDESVGSCESIAVTTPNDSGDESKNVENKTQNSVSSNQVASATSSTASLSSSLPESTQAEKPQTNTKTKEAKPLSPKPADNTPVSSPTTNISSEKKLDKEKVDEAGATTDYSSAKAPLGSKAGKRKLDDSAATTAETTKQQPAVKKSKQDNGKPGKPVANQSLKDQSPPPEMSSALPATPKAAQKTRPAGRDYQPIVAAMLDDPLGFEDHVHDDNRAPTRMLIQLRRELASCRHAYNESEPPAMSGALGPTPDERFDEIKKKQPYRNPQSQQRRGGRPLRPRAGYKGDQHHKRQQHQQQQHRGGHQKQFQRGGFKGRQQQHQKQFNKYNKGSRFYSDGSKNVDVDGDGDDEVPTMSGAMPAAEVKE